MTEGLDDCTQYEGKDGYALVDRATYDAVLAENRRLRLGIESLVIAAGLQPSGDCSADLLNLLDVVSEDDE